MIFFITGNKNKFAEVKTIIPEVEQLDIDLPEIQDIDAKVIIREKLKAARRHKKASFIVEDTGLYLSGLKGLPGPLIKWFLTTIGNDGLYRLVKGLGDFKAEARTIVGYAKSVTAIRYFTGKIKGKIVSPRGPDKFGFDPIFQPRGFKITFAEMSKEQKNIISMRRQALDKLKKFLAR